MGPRCPIHFEEPWRHSMDAGESAMCPTGSLWSEAQAQNMCLYGVSSGLAGNINSMNMGSMATTLKMCDPAVCETHKYKSERLEAKVLCERQPGRQSEAHNNTIKRSNALTKAAQPQSTVARGRE
jgi:hypothetical protein